MLAMCRGHLFQTRVPHGYGYSQNATARVSLIRATIQPENDASLRQPLFSGYAINEDREGERFGDAARCAVRDEVKRGQRYAKQRINT